MERGLMPMSKNKRILMLLAKGGVSQSGIAAALHVSKRDVSAGARALREHGLTFDAVSSMDADVVDDLFFPRERRGPNGAYLQPDMESLVERKKRNRKLPVKLFWIEYCEQAAAEGRLAYAYQTFCEMFAGVAERMGATRHFIHEAGARCHIDWAGDTAHLTDKLPGAKTKVHVLVVVLPFSGRFWAGGFCDMRQRSWQEGQMHAFEEFGGVPRMWVPDNAATATNRAAPQVTLVNEEYGRLADHYGAAIVPARVRKPRDKSVAESVVDLAGRWIVSPSNEMTFYTIDELGEFCADRVAWLNSRPSSAKDGSRDSVFEEEERPHLMPLPAERYEMCEWRSPKVAPDYHVVVDHMRYSVPCRLVGEQTDVKMTSSTVTVLHGGEVVAVHPRLRGRKGQYSTIDDHMPESHAALDNPRSPERLASWAKRIGPETGIAIGRVMESRVIVEQSFVSCRNILGLSKTHAPALPGRACAGTSAASAPPGHAGVKNTILAIRAADVELGAAGRRTQPAEPGELVDRARSAGRLRGADAYKRGGDRRC